MGKMISEMLHYGFGSTLLFRNRKKNIEKKLFVKNVFVKNVLLSRNSL